MEKLNQLVLKGIRDGQRAFIGPKIAQIDLTGKCNNNCIGCWVHSPFIKNPPRDKNISLSFSEVRRLINDLADLGTEEIYLSGAGEPFLHPEILEIVELIKMRNLRLNIITNFILFDEQKAKKLLELDVDMLTVSIWAATPEVYIKTHPGKTKEDFYKIKDNLKRLSQLKAAADKSFPHVKIYNVICNLNYREIRQMIDFGLDTQVEFIEFQIMDIIEGQTSFLALSDEQIRNVKEQFDTLAKSNKLYFKEIKLFNLRSPKEKELKEFPGRFINIPQGFLLAEEIRASEKQSNGAEALRSLICPRGVRTSPSIRNPIYNGKDRTLTFTFPHNQCKKYLCPDCLLDKKERFKVKFLSILSFASFMRRVNSANIYEQTYEREIIDSLPCYIAWTYSRILSTGEVIPCCKAVFKPLGNIYKDSFVTIWNSAAYWQFRYKAKSLSKRNPYFKEINCYKSCDNVGMNLQIKELVSSDKKQQDLKCRFFASRKVWIKDGLPKAGAKLIIPAKKFLSGNLNMQEHLFGSDLVVDGGWGFGFAEYKIPFRKSDRYELWSYYAAHEPRPVELYFDGSLIKKEALNSTTPGWTTADLHWFKETVLDVQKGEHILKIYTGDAIPHIHSFAFIRANKGNQQRVKRCPPADIPQRASALKMLKDKFSTLGFVNSSFRLLNYVKSGRLVKDYLDILGIYNGRYAFKGPFHVQLDLTNNCNNNCIGCWCNSPLLEEKALSPQVKRQTLPLALVKELLEELWQMGTKEIYFSGAGEPFMHPQIMQILGYAKNKGFNCHVNTNFTLLNKDMIKELIELGVEHLTVSTWSATPANYARTHPNKNEDTFRQITENLKFLNRTKQKTPYIKLYNVIFNMNYHELQDMVGLAKDTGSESVEFTLIDTIPGKTDKLLLNAAQIKELQDSARSIAERLDSRGYWDGVLLFRFDSFLRRICSSLDLSKATYDRNVIDKMPCYIGWCFSRIMPNGDVNACLKAHRIPVGNLYQDNFRQIWNGKKQQQFRGKTLVYKKQDPFFRLIGNDPDIKEAGCYKSCDDIGRNMHIHSRIMSLTSIERAALKVISKIKQRPALSLNSRDKSNQPVISGIINGRRAFAGPEQVVIDITNRCNERCIGCWLYSPFLKEAPDPRWLKQEIDFTKAKRLIDDLAGLGTKRVRFTGGGEPLMYPRIMELLDYTKTRGLKCCLTTNFSLLNRERLRDLISLEIDELAISLWASNEQTYRRTHPGVSAGAFEVIIENLMAFIAAKKNRPFVTLCNVICSLNYLTVEEMFKFALDMHVDGIYFTLVDIIKNATDCLLLDEQQRQEVLRQVERIKQIHQGLPPEGRIRLDYFDGFIARLQEKNASAGNYDQQRVNQIPCYAGWIFARILADGTIAPCCRGVKKPMGNINERSFKDIWFTGRYNEFRTKAKYLSKTEPYFSEIGCMKMCDNLMHNEQMHQLISESIKR